MHLAILCPLTFLHCFSQDVAGCLLLYKFEICFFFYIYLYKGGLVSFLSKILLDNARTMHCIHMQTNTLFGSHTYNIKSNCISEALHWLVTRGNNSGRRARCLYNGWEEVIINLPVPPSKDFGHTWNNFTHVKTKEFRQQPHTGGHMIFDAAIFTKHCGVILLGASNDHLHKEFFLWNMKSPYNIGQ